MDGPIAYSVALLVLLAFSAFFSGSEAALFSLSRRELGDLPHGSAPGREVVRLLAHPRRLLITILIGNLLVNVFATSAATSFCLALFGEKGVGVAFAVMSVLIVICGEVVPKAIAINRPRRSAKAIIYPLRFFHVVFTIVSIPIARLTDAIIESLKKRLGAARLYFSTEELLSAIEIGRHEGQVGEFEYKLLSSIITFRDTVVREIMTPSIEVFSLPMNMGRDEMLERMLERELSRVPVYADGADDIRGVLHIKDLAVLDADEEDGIARILRPPFYVPETTRISELFKDLARRRIQMALVIDEFGSFVGIVTLEDIVEELVGEIRDAKEPWTTEYTLLDDGRIVVQGSMSIDAFNEIFDTGLTDDENESMAGYVTGMLGSIPGEGETIELGGLRFHIISAQPNRIRKMRVEKI